MDFFLSNTQSNQFKPLNTNESSLKPIEQKEFKHFKRGDRIKIVRKENGSFNYYKGYIGEIKSLKKDSDYAMIILNAMNYSKLMKVPCDHFIHLE